jgi:hypothetical protein
VVTVDEVVVDELVVGLVPAVVLVGGLLVEEVVVVGEVVDVALGVLEVPG